MDVRVGLWRKLSAFDWCFWTVVLEKTLESPLDCKEIQPVHPKGNHSWIFIGRTDAEAETLILWPPDVKNYLTLWKKPWFWPKFKAGGKGDDRGWNDWMASLTQWTWVWMNSGRWWWTGRPGVLRFMGSQRVRNDWATELNWTELFLTGLLCAWCSAAYLPSPMTCLEQLHPPPAKITNVSRHCLVSLGRQHPIQLRTNDTTNQMYGPYLDLDANY